MRFWATLFPIIITLVPKLTAGEGTTRWGVRWHVTWITCKLERAWYRLEDLILFASICFNACCMHISYIWLNYVNVNRRLIVIEKNVAIPEYNNISYNLLGESRFFGVIFLFCLFPYCHSRVTLRTNLLISVSHPAILSVRNSNTLITYYPILEAKEYWCSNCYFVKCVTCLLCPIVVRLPLG
jgi:hypothetical protein